VSDRLNSRRSRKLLPLGAAAIEGGHAAVIDLAGVKDSDSSGLALLIEWLSVAKERDVRCATRICRAIAPARGLSEVEGLFQGACLSNLRGATAAYFPERCGGADAVGLVTIRRRQRRMRGNLPGPEGLARTFARTQPLTIAWVIDL